MKKQPKKPTKSRAAAAASSSPTSARPGDDLPPNAISSIDGPEKSGHKILKSDLMGRYQKAIAIHPPAHRKSTGDNDKLAHVEYVERITGKKIA